ncbi:C40 family peptidase [Rhizobium sp. CFBP 13726]|uniref:NlpC/P60 family protein n=1 Tax=Rhizobium sp. CFBP 13726 TaxID=2775296 RepID=UPI00177FEBDD|nr:NlpC/P60 family protein [Rhizobium sp. CFBP 13726]MBD8649826.1 C40 family peptidase [Rhizobium sp. CFBP 13726]
MSAEQIVAIAQSWIGTPYRHQGATRGIGCDCIGLIRGIWRDLYGEEPEPVGPYAPDWAERGGEDRLLEAGIRLFGPALGLGQMQPSDLLLFRWRPDTMVKHAGIFVGPSHFIHAYEQMAVTRSVLVPSWRRKIAAVHRFPRARDS